MEILFRDKRLENITKSDAEMVKRFGKIRAEKIKQRLDQLRYANNLEDVRFLSGNYHELKNNRKGQWACDLDQPYRLIFTAAENPIPINRQGQYKWIETIGIEIIEIINYHKEK